VTVLPELLLVGLSHRTAGVELRERCSLEPSAQEARLRTLLALAGVREAWIVSTCNRTEVLVATSTRAQSTDGEFARTVRDVALPSAPPEATYVYQGLEAVMHLFRVAAGLDSQILGESQILAQLKDAYARAKTLGCLGRLLEPLLQQALATGKRVRAETAVGGGTLSVARAGVEIATRVFGGFRDATALVVGAGATGRLVARHLKEARLQRLVFVNRTLERAREAAEELHGEAAALDRLPELLRGADLVLCCVEGAPGIVHADLFDRRALARRDRPMVVVDLSVPRAVAPEVERLRNVFSYDLDDLAQVVDKNRSERQRAGEESAPILLAEVHKFLGLRTYAVFAPGIERMRERFDAVREQELDAASAGVSSPEILRLAHKLTAHLLDVALDELKQGAREVVAPETVDEAYQRFLEGQ